jgi:hypothetical protein
VRTQRECEEVVQVVVGDCILFDARTLHASISLPVTRTGSLRLAIAIQWISEGGLDGATPGSHPRWPASDVPPLMNTATMYETFGMDSAGRFLKRALVTVKCPSVRADQGDDTESQNPLFLESLSTLDLATELSSPENDASRSALRHAGCDTDALVDRAQEALRQYVMLRRAGKLHFGEGQGGRVFQALNDYLIKLVMRPPNH